MIEKIGSLQPMVNRTDMGDHYSSYATWNEGHSPRLRPKGKLMVDDGQWASSTRSIESLLFQRDKVGWFNINFTSDTRIYLPRLLSQLKVNTNYEVFALLGDGVVNM